VRAVLDPNVIISGVLSPAGGPAQVLRALEAGEFELVVCQALIDELARAFAYPKLRQHIPQADAEALTRWIERSATKASNPTLPPPAHAADPDDDYLIALAAAQRAILVSGDKHLLDLASEIPVLSPRQFLEFLATPCATDTPPT
jgi:putative PIN family toxin of toxin-antitoxin system